MYPPNYWQTVVYFLYQSVLNGKKFNGQPPFPNMNFVPTAQCVGRLYCRGVVGDVFALCVHIIKHFPLLQDESNSS